MGGFLDKPKTNKYNEHGEGLKLNYGVSSMQGWRSEMEDAHIASTKLGEPFSDWSFFAVFDGHAGCKVSEHCAKNLLKVILETDEFKNGEFISGIRTGFLRIDEVMRVHPELTAEPEKIGGTTAVCSFIAPNQLYIANCGDSRAVLCRNGRPVFATQDHKPELPKETKRIQQAGGSVMIQRVNGSLAVSRALGDYDFKNDREKGQCEQLVSPEPEVWCQERQADDEFLVLACDGVWDVMTNEDICSFIQSRLMVTNDLELVSNQVIDTCLHKGSRDNMSVIIIVFPGAPQPSAEAIAADQRLEKEIENLAREELTIKEQIQYVELVDAIQRKQLSDLPPGGGLHSKYHVLENVYKEFYPNTEDQCESPMVHDEFDFKSLN